MLYGASASEAERFKGGNVFVVGGGYSAGQAAVHLSRYAKQVTILVRGKTLATSMSRYLIDEIEQQPNIEVRYETQVVDGSGDGRPEQLVLRDARAGATDSTAADALFVLIGAHPNTDWLPSEIARDEYGYVITGVAPPGSSLGRQPLMFESTIPGVFAVGDVRSGSVKRVASAVAEAPWQFSSWTDPGDGDPFRVSDSRSPCTRPATRPWAVTDTPRPRGVPGWGTRRSNVSCVFVWRRSASPPLWRSSTTESRGRPPIAGGSARKSA